MVHPFSLIIAIVLVFPNIWLAYAKWKLTLSTIGVESNLKSRVQSFFAGIVTGMLTPNMLGNFIGRFYYFDQKDRSQIISFTLLANFAQFMASVTFGTLAVLYVGELMLIENSRGLTTWLFVCVILAYLVYFFVDNFVGLLKKKPFLADFKSILKDNKWYRTKILFLSYGRFVLFTLQFSLVLNSFGAEWNVVLIAAIWQVYLITMLVPSLVLGKIGVKEAIAISVIGQLDVNEFSILFASLIIWFVNSMSPALIGFVVCRNREEL